MVGTGFSLLLLCFLMVVWRSFYVDPGSAQSAQRLIMQHRVSLANPLPAYYRDQIRRVSGVTHVVPLSWFGGIYRDNKPENFFARFGTDPEEFFETYKELSIPADQLEAWIRDRAGAVADIELARKILADSPQNVDSVATELDRMFSNAPEPTRTMSERAYQLSFISMLGNVRTFILSISLAVVFTSLLVAGNTMAMSTRERTREVAVLKTLGFRQDTILALLVGEGVMISLLGGILGSLSTLGLLMALSQSPYAALFFGMQRQWVHALLPAWSLAAVVGFVSSFVPAYNASRIDIVEGLHYIG